MKHRFQVLDIFRGLFASFVFLFHLSPFAETPILNNSFIDNSDMFVDFFFVLSGFVIAYSYQSLSNWSELRLFLTKRIYRIYPLHLFMLLAFVGMEVAKNILSPYIKVNNLINPSNNILTFFTSLFLVNSTPIRNVHDVSWNIPSWSISAEMMAYLVFGGLVVFLFYSNQVARRNLYYALIIIIALACLWFVSGTFKINYSFEYGFLRGILGFFTGVLCFNLFSKSHLFVRTLPSLLFSIGEIVILSIICFCIYNGPILKSSGAVYEAIFFICIYIFSFEKGVISDSFKKIKLLENLGKYSYSIYMTHALLISLFNVLFIRILKIDPVNYSYLFILNFVLIYFVSAWTYKNIEMRFQYKSPKKVGREVKIII